MLARTEILKRYVVRVVPVDIQDRLFHGFAAGMERPLRRDLPQRQDQNLRQPPAENLRASKLHLPVFLHHPAKQRADAPVFVVKHTVCPVCAEDHPVIPHQTRLQQFVQTQAAAHRFIDGLRQKQAVDQRQPAAVFIAVCTAEINKKIVAAMQNGFYIIERMLTGAAGNISQFKKQVVVPLQIPLLTLHHDKAFVFMLRVFLDLDRLVCHG